MEDTTMNIIALQSYVFGVRLFWIAILFDRPYDDRVTDEATVCSLSRVSPDMVRSVEPTHWQVSGCPASASTDQKCCPRIRSIITDPNSICIKDQKMLVGRWPPSINIRAASVGRCRGRTDQPDKHHIEAPSICSLRLDEIWVALLIVRWISVINYLAIIFYEIYLTVLNSNCE